LYRYDNALNHIPRFEKPLRHYACNAGRNKFALNRFGNLEEQLGEISGAGAMHVRISLQKCNLTFDTYRRLGERLERQAKEISKSGQKLFRPGGVAQHQLAKTGKGRE